MSASRNGGVYINRPESEHLLSYNDQGVVIGRIPLLDEAAAILETSNGLLLVAHYGLKIIICYNDGSQNFRYFQFAKTPSFHPIGLSELRNGDIVICGPEKLGNKETDIKGNYNGVIRTYTQQGRLLREFAFEKPEQILTFPTEITCNSKRDTIAVCDTTQKKVHVLDYEGKLLASYNGFSWIPELETFHPVSVCSTHNGYYLIADIRSEYLHVLDPQGKFIGILRCENGECLSETNTVCVDSKNNIWIGHYGQGTVTVLKQTRFKNNLQPSSLPFLPARPQDADLSFLSGLQLADHI